MAGHRVYGNRVRGQADRRCQVRRSPEGEPVALDGDLDEDAWFSRPWRDGFHAVRLLDTLCQAVGGRPLPSPLLSTLARPAHEADATVYATIAQVGIEASLWPGVDGVVVPAAAACLCNWIANSHAGGLVPNVYLRSTVGWLLWRGADIDLVRLAIGEARAVDQALTTEQHLEFLRHWLRRQYALAWRIVDS